MITAFENLLDHSFTYIYSTEIQKGTDGLS